ncbi:MAG: hypothetical protein AB7R77_24035 [Ilumatobacteraceae bacterium]
MTQSAELDEQIDAVLTAQWHELGAPGTWFRGSERVAIAQVCRDADRHVDLAEATHDAARCVAHDAAGITAADVDWWESDGLDREHYVEVVGIVSRVVAIDTYDRAVGRLQRALPAPLDGEPSGQVEPAAKRRSGWVPAVGAIGPPTALSAVPAEALAQRELHTALYLSYEGMADLDATSGLHRTQMELVAARVSLLNDCFF